MPVRPYQTDWIFSTSPGEQDRDIFAFSQMVVSPVEIKCNIQFNELVCICTTINTKTSNIKLSNFAHTFVYMIDIDPCIFAGFLTFDYTTIC